MSKLFVLADVICNGGPLCSFFQHKIYDRSMDQTVSGFSFIYKFVLVFDTIN